MSGPLVDAFGREHSYLRISVTDRCNFRCVYCLPAEGMSWKPREDLLSFEEIGTLVQVFASMGIERVRLTGGEPTIRSDIASLVRVIAATPGIRDVAMTTNAHTLQRLAGPLAEAGLSRVNISLDSLRADRFRKLTRGGDLARVLTGIESAREAGLTPIKINAVLLTGQNEDELFDLVDFFGRWPDTTTLRFIEYMPFQARWHKSVSSAELRRRLSTRVSLVPQRAEEKTGTGPSRTWTVAETGLTVGFISPLSEHFCATCNRLRLGADGHLRTCLAHEDTPSLRALLREGASEARLARAIRAMVLGKPEGHDCQVDGGVPFEGVMTRIGG